MNNTPYLYFFLDYYAFRDRKVEEVYITCYLLPEKDVVLCTEFTKRRTKNVSDIEWVKKIVLPKLENPEKYINERAISEYTDIDLPIFIDYGLAVKKDIQEDIRVFIPDIRKATQGDLE